MVNTMEIPQLLRKVADEIEVGDKEIIRATYTPVDPGGNERVEVVYTDD